MKLVLASRTGAADGVYHTLIGHIKSKCDIVLVNWCENFLFNEELLMLKDYVLIDFCEYGYDHVFTETHIWGINSKKFPRYYNNDWVKFDNWVKGNPPKLILKREFIKDDFAINYSHNVVSIKPIEYPCTVWNWELDTEEKFNNRPLSCFQYWGRSNENRLRIHGNIWHHATKKGFSVCDNLFFIERFILEEKGEKWVTLWIPHYYRSDVNQLMPFNAMAKLSLSWEGAGQKCFRHGEAPCNSVMVMHKNNLAWSHEWNETNCILVEHGKEMEGIDEALKNPNLYEIYKAGVENCNKYRLESYLPYLENIINNA